MEDALKLKVVVNKKDLIREVKLKDLEKKVYSLSSEISIKTTKHKLLSDTEKNNEGYFRSVKVILDECDKNPEFKKGILGSLAKLINVPEKYETAIEIALGGNLQNIVTKTPICISALVSARKSICLLFINFNRKITIIN